MRHLTIDKNLLARRAMRSLPTYDRAAVVQGHMAKQLVGDIMSASGTARFDRVLEFGCGTGLLTRELLRKCRLGCLVLNDLVPEYEPTLRQLCRRKPGVTVQFVPGDMETVEFPRPQDLIVSNAVFQWAADSQGMLKRMTGLLRPGGILAVASFGSANLREVSQITGLSLHYKSPDEWRMSLEGRYEFLSVREDTRTLWFNSAHEVLRHMKETGVNALESRPLPPANCLRFCRTYEATFGRRGKIPLTYHPVYVVARKLNDEGVHE